MHLGGEDCEDAQQTTWTLDYFLHWTLISEYSGRCLQALCPCHQSFCAASASCSAVSSCTADVAPVLTALEQLQANPLLSKFSQLVTTRKGSCRIGLTKESTTNPKPFFSRSLLSTPYTCFGRWAFLGKGSSKTPLKKKKTGGKRTRTTTGNKIWPFWSFLGF
jgi:hypothetical protein